MFPGILSLSVVEPSDLVNGVASLGDRVCVVSDSVVDYFVDHVVQYSAFAFYGLVRFRYCFILYVVKVRQIYFGVRWFV